MNAFYFLYTGTLTYFSIMCVNCCIYHFFKKSFIKLAAMHCSDDHSMHEKELIHAKKLNALFIRAAAAASERGLEGSGGIITPLFG